MLRSEWNRQYDEAISCRDFARCARLRKEIEPDPTEGVHMTLIRVLTFAEDVRKAAVAFYSTAAPAVALLATQDFSTPTGVLVALVPFINALVVHQTTNSPE